MVFKACRHKSGTLSFVHVFSIPSKRIVRLAIALMAIAVAGWMVFFTGQLGLSRIFAVYGMATRNFVAANEAVRMSPSDSETHLARALLLKSAGSVAESALELEQAVALRPRDYVLWIELGMTREELGDNDGAVVALSEAVRLAPRYAMPKWQRGNLFLRIRRYDEAFADLRAAAQSNPELVPNLIDLAWGFSQNNATVAQQLAGLNTEAMHGMFAQYLASRGEAAAALEQFKLAGPMSEEKKTEIVKALLNIGAYSEAYQVWSNGATSNSLIHDGSFEGPLGLGASDFGWRVRQGLLGAQLSIDSQQPAVGEKSLRIEFTGESVPQSAVISQLIVVDPNSNYELTFAVRSEELVTGGLPFLSMSDAADGKNLGQSTTFGKESSNWATQSFSFTTGASTKAIVLALQRQGCSTSPCPAFGTMWLDSLMMKRVKTERVN